MLIEITYNVTDVFMSTTETPVYVEISFEQPGGSAAVWGGITGTLSNQTDLQNALNAKFDDPTGTTSQYIRGDGTLATFPALTGYVPYTGATTNVDLGEYELKAGQVTLDTSPTGTAAVGTIRWNDTTGTSETTLKGGNVIIKNGVDLVARVVNKVTPNTTLTKAAYQAVRVSGAQGQRLAIELAQANNDAGSADTIGLVTETIAPNQEGFIMTVGQLEGINTTGSLQGETWVDGDVLYLSPTTAGRVTNIKPTAVTGHIVVIGYVEYAHVNNGKIYVKVMNGWELDELHNVSIVTPTNNQGLFYNSSNSLWENKSIATVLGYTPEQPLTFNSPLSRAGNVVSIPQATGSVNGFLSATDWTTFNSKQAALGFTPANAATTLTINGVTFDLSANRTWTISAGISGSGASGQVTYWTGASAVSGSNNLFWDNANSRLGIGTNAPAVKLDVNGDFRFNGTNGFIYDTANSRINFGNVSSINFPNAFQIAIPVANYGAAFYAENTSTSAEGYIAAKFAARGSSTTQLGGNTEINLQQKNNTNNNYALFNFLNATATGSSFFGTRFVNHNAAGSQTADFLIGTANAGTQSTKFYIFANGNTVLQNGGTFTDGGQRLQVIGDTLLRGSGSTIATTALTVQNSSSTNLLRVLNDGDVSFGADAFYWDAVTSRLGIGTNAPLVNLDIISTANAYLRVQRGNNVTNDAAFVTQPQGTLSASNVSWNYGLQANSNNFRFWYYNGTTTATALNITNTGNVHIGSGTDATVRLQVTGDTLLRGSGATSATTALTVQNSSSTNLFRVFNNGDINIGGGTQDYVFAKRANLVLTLQSQLTGSLQQTEYYTKDGDGTDDNGFAIFARGIPSDITNFEQFRYFYSASLTSYVIGTNKGGTGVFRDIRIGNSLTPTDLVVKADTGNVMIGTTTDLGYRLGVVGDTLLRGSGNTSATTALTVQNSSSTNLFSVRNDGLATFGGNMILSFDQNATTNLRVRNLTNGSASAAEVILQSDTNSGSCSFSKTSTSVATYKILVAKDFQIYNGPTGGDIAFLNDFATGQIKFAAGASSTAHMTIKSNGRINMSSLPTSSTGLAAGDLWNDAGTVKIV